MNSNIKGNLGEAKALYYFINQGYEVYTSFGTGSSCDMIVLKNNIPQRVSVKTTTVKDGNSWMVSLRQTRAGINCDFKKENFDLLAVYIQLEDRIVVYDVNNIKGKTTMNIKSIGH